MELGLNRQQMLKIVDNALAEDIGTGDLTTEAVVDSTQQVQGELIAKEEGVIAGLAVAGLVFERLDTAIDYQEKNRRRNSG